MSDIHSLPIASRRSGIHVPRAVRGWVVPAGLLLLWWAAFHFGWSTSSLLVSPAAVWQRAVRYAASGELLTALGASLWRNLAGFASPYMIGYLKDMTSSTASGRSVCSSAMTSSLTQSPPL